jgi:hypothetical protein
LAERLGGEEEGAELIEERNRGEKRGLDSLGKRP